MTVPDKIPDTIPVGDTVAIAVLDDVHVPPGVVLVSSVVPPVHTVAVPLSVPASGSGLTVTTCVALAVPQLFVCI